MIDLFAVFTTGGILLWLKSTLKIEYGPILSEFVHAALVEGTAVMGVPMTLASAPGYEVRWTKYDNWSLTSTAAGTGLVFIAMYRKILPLKWVPALLDQAKLQFVKSFGSQLEENPFSPIPYEDWSTSFDALCRMAEERLEAERKTSSPVPSAGKKGSTTSTKTVGKKEKRDWGDKVSKDTLNELDLSSDKHLADGARRSTQKVTFNSSGKLEEIEWVESDDEDGGSQSRISSFFSSLSGNREITKDDLTPILTKMKEHLMGKNVAAEVAEFICTSVGDSLVGKKAGVFSSVSNLVKNATQDAVQKILSPKGSNQDLVEEIANKDGKPYVMAFIGVNGVGKSTNLSKVCFWLLQNKLRVLLVAGDTFRSGAVEQLRTHLKNLSSGFDSAEESRLELFERGYGKDAAVVAKEAIAYAGKNKFDVVMIDTAGRMQDNNPLMVALAKLIQMSHPDKIIFVGEALVGNEAIDQLKKFNSALTDYWPGDRSAAPRINGILLTKFDTVDDKVGAALSMTFISKAPILFAGTGQTYTDLRRVNVSFIVSTLLK